MTSQNNKKLDCTSMSNSEASEIWWCWYRIDTDGIESFIMTEEQYEYIENEIENEEFPTESKNDTWNALFRSVEISDF